MDVHILQIFQLWWHLLSCLSSLSLLVWRGRQHSLSRSSRDSPHLLPTFTTNVRLNEDRLRRTYSRPFRHALGPRAYRVVPDHRDTSRGPPRQAVYFELRRPEGWVWIYPGQNGGKLTIDEFNRVRAFRIDHPSAQPNLRG